MNLSDPLSTLFRGNDAAVLRVMSRFDDEATGRRIQQLADGSYSSIRLALGRLSATGLITARVLDHATLYSLNREHLLWPAVAKIIESRQALVERIRHHLRDDEDTKDAPAGLSVSFFGSVARHESTLFSDIDLAVIYVDDDQHREKSDRIAALSENVHEWTGNDVQIFDITRDELLAMSHRHDPLVHSWVMDAETIIGPNVQELVRTSA
jgi:predicted nucleotidyltransferase